MFVTVVALVVILVLPGQWSTSPPSNSLESERSLLAHSSVAHGVVRSWNPQPSGTPPTELFFQNSSSVANGTFNASNSYCYPAAYCQGANPAYYDSIYYNESSSPTLLSLENSEIGLAYQTILNTSQSVCGYAENQSISHVAFDRSTDGGVNWGSPIYIGDTNSTCPYNQEIEPTFAVNQSGAIVGVYVGANASLFDLGNGSAWGIGGVTRVPSPIVGYVNRSSDALIFVKSVNNGTSFSTGSIIAAGENFARPQVAVFGSTIYVAYENISNGTTPLSGSNPIIVGGSNNPISVCLLVSFNGGLSWKGPFALPGENSSQQYTAMSPSISISPSGEVAVAYVTNRTCLAFCGPPVWFSEFGDDVVVATSASNGSSWNLSTVFHATGEPAESYASCCPTFQAKGSWVYASANPGFWSYNYKTPVGFPTALFQYAPPTAISWNTSGTSLFVAWGGSYNESAFNWLNPQSDYSYQALYFSTSTDGGQTWSVQLLGTPGGTPGGGTGLPQRDQNYPLDYYNIGLTIEGGEIYLAYQTSNQSASLGPGDVGLCGLHPFSAYEQSTVEWLLRSSDGSHWLTPLPVTSLGSFGGIGYQHGPLQPYLEYSSSVLLTNDTPVIATSLPEYCPAACDTSQGQNTLMAALNVATAFNPSVVVNITVHESGLPPGTDWSVQISGNTLEGSTPSLVGMAPSDLSVIIQPESPLNVNGTTYQAYSGGGDYVFGSDVTIQVGYVSLVPFNLNVDPSSDEGVSLSITNSTWGFGYSSQTAFEYVSPSYTNPPYANAYYGGYWSFQGCPMPWHLPVGYVLNVTPSDELDSNLSVGSLSPPTYWTGNGPGSYTGANSSFSLTLMGPVNETMWTTPFGYFGVTVSAEGLPASSTFRFDWDGSAVASASGEGSATVPMAETGSHVISNISATSSQAGWVYVGSAPDDGVVLVPEQTHVNLSFAYIDIGTPAGIVSFHAANLSAGDSWQLGFNGTTYSSNTPWINVTAHTGTYTISPGVATSANGSVGFVAQPIGPWISVSAGSVTAVNYTQAFKVMLTASKGGTVSPSGVQWYRAGEVTPPLYAEPSFGYQFVGWSGTGAGAYNGTAATPILNISGPVSELASFAPLPSNRFDLNFTEAGLPTGQAWQVEVNGTAYGASGANLVIHNLLPSPAHYSYAIPYVYGADPSNPTRYVASPESGTVVAGTNFENPITFETQHYLTLDSGPGGNASATVGMVAGFSTWFPSGGTIQLQASPDAGFSFYGWNGTGPGSYTGAALDPTIYPNGSVTEFATFAPIVPPVQAVYAVEFGLAEPLLPGTEWSVTINGSTFTSTGLTLNVTNLPAGVTLAQIATTYSPDRDTQYSPVNPIVSFRVGPSASPISVLFETSYWLALDAVGPGSLSRASGWVHAGTTLSVQALPLAGDVLLGWTGTGSGAYSGPSSFINVTVGGSITEVATFGAVGFTQANPTTASPFLESDAGIALLGVAGLVAGALASLFFRRRRGPGPPTGEFEPGHEIASSSAVDADPNDPSGIESRTLTHKEYPPSSRVLRRRAGGGAVWIVSLIVILSLPAGISASHLQPSAPTGVPFHGDLGIQHATLLGPSTSGRGTFWTNSLMSNVSSNNLCLELALGLGCGSINITNEPSINLSSRGVLVAAYTAYTNRTPCESEFPILANYTYTEVGVATSTDNGTTWSTPTYLGNTECANASVANDFINAWQPSVTSLANGTLVVAFVEFNLSVPTGCSYCYLTFPWVYQNDSAYWDSYSGLSDFNSSQVVVSFSYDNGVRWTAPIPINTSSQSGSWCASGCQTYANWIQQRPSITAFGQTIYLTWTNITVSWSEGGPFGWSNTYPSYCAMGYTWACAQGDSAVQLAVSLTGGTNFSGPTQLPVRYTPGSGLWIAANPSIVVTPTGTLAVAYASNYTVNSTLPTGFGTGYQNGGFVSDLLVAQSSDNGTNWTVGVAAAGVYDSQDYDHWYYGGFAASQDLVNEGDRLLPAPEAAYDPSSGQVVIAYVADSNVPDYCSLVAAYTEGYNTCSPYSSAEVWTANGSLTSNSWSHRVLSSWAAMGNGTTNGALDSYFYNPAIAITAAGTIYVSSQFVNGSACTEYSTSSWMENVLNGPGWTYYPTLMPYCGEGLEVVGVSNDNGTSFTSPSPVDPNGTWWEQMPAGLQASMVAAGNEVWIAWTQSSCPGLGGPNPNVCSMMGDYFYYWYWTANYTSNTSVVVSRLSEGPGLTLTMWETGLPTGENWSVDVSSNERAGPAGTSLSIGGVPAGVAESWSSPNISVAPGVRYTATPSISSPSSITASTTITWTFTLEYALNISATPDYPNGSALAETYFEGAEFCPLPATSADFYPSGSESLVFNPDGVCAEIMTNVNYNMTPGPGVTWHAAGSSVPVQAIPLNLSSYFCVLPASWFSCEGDYVNLTFDAWSGVGNGSYNGSLNSTTLVMNGPINETANFGLVAFCFWGNNGTIVTTRYSSCLPNAYPIGFRETGLPSGDLWGVSLSGTGLTPSGETLNGTLEESVITNGSNLIVENPTIGPSVNFETFTVPSAIPGEVWSASADPVSPLTPPLSGSSTLVYTLAPLATTSFKSTIVETGLPNGTAWSVAVDGSGVGFTGSTGNLTMLGGNRTLSPQPVYLENGTGFVPGSISVDPFVINETWANSSGASTTFDWEGPSLIEVNYTPVYELTVQASDGGSVTDAGTSWLPPSSTVELTATASSGYHFVEWTGMGGWGVTSNSPSIKVQVDGPGWEFATFAPNATATYIVLVNATGILPGGTFSVVFNGTTYEGSGTFALPAYVGGDYTISAAISYDNASSLTRFIPLSITTSLPSGPNGSYVLGAAGGKIEINFATQFALIVGTSGEGTTSPVSGTYWETSGNVTTLSAAAASGYEFQGWAGSGPGARSSPLDQLTLTSDGPEVEDAIFAAQTPNPPATFALSIQETGLPNGTPWTVVAGTQVSDVTSTVASVGDLNGTYVVTVPTIWVTSGDRYISNVSNASVQVETNRTIAVAFAHEYLVTVVVGTGGSATPATVWVSAGASVAFTATPYAGYTFTAWIGSGSGNLTGNATFGTAIADGPLTEVAQFAPTRSGNTINSSNPPSPLLPWAAFMALIVIGLTVGLVLRHRRDRAKPSGHVEPDSPRDESPILGEEPESLKPHEEGTGLGPGETT